MADIDIRINTNAEQASGSFERLRATMRNVGEAQSAVQSGAAAVNSGLNGSASAASQAANAVQGATGAMRGFASAAGSVASAAGAVAGAVVGAGRAATGAAREMAGVVRETRSLARAMEQAAALTGAATSSLRNAGGAAAGFTSRIVEMGVAFAALQGISKLVNLGTEAQQLENKLSRLGTSAEDTARELGTVTGIAERTKAPIGSIAQLYQRLRLALDDTGKSASFTAGITETLANIIKVSGATTAEASGGLTQLSQAFATGVLRGEEFNSVSESMPDVLREVGKAMGLTIGQLRSYSKENGISMDIVVSALQKAGGKYKELADKMKDTLPQALEFLNTRLVTAAAAFEKFTGLNASLAQSIIFVANNIGVFSAALTVLGAIIAVNYIGKMATSFTLLGEVIKLMNPAAAIRNIAAAWTALTVAMNANPISAVIAIIALVVGAIILFRSTIAKAMQTMADWFGVGPQMAAFLSVIRSAFNFLAATIQTLMIALGLVEPPLAKITEEADKQRVAVSGLSGELDGLATAYGTTGKSVLDFKDNLVDPAAINEAKKVVAGYGTAMQGLAAKQNNVSIATRTLADTQLNFGAAAAAGNLQAQTAILNAHTEVAIATGKVNEHKEAMATLTAAETAQNSVLVETVGQSQRFAAVTAESTAAVGEQAKAIQATKDESVSSFSLMADAASSMASSIESSLSSAISSVISYVGSLISRVREAISALAELAGAKSSAGSTDTVAAPDSVAPTDSASTSATSQLSAFAVGGQFMVGGSGGVDSRLVQFWASPDERVVIETPMQQKISDQYRARLPKFANGGTIDAESGGPEPWKRFEEGNSFASSFPEAHYYTVGVGTDAISGNSFIEIARSSGEYFFNDTILPWVDGSGQEVVRYDSVGAATSALISATQQGNSIVTIEGLGGFKTVPGEGWAGQETPPTPETVAEMLRGVLAKAESDGVSRIIDGRFPTKDEDPSGDNFHPTRDDNGKPIPGSGNADDYDRGTHKRVRWPKGKDPESLEIKAKVGGIDDIRARTAKENYLVDRAVSGSSAKGTRGDMGNDFEKSGKYVDKGGKTYLKGSQGRGGGVDKNPAMMTNVTMNISTPNASTFLKNSNAIRQKQRVQSASS